MKYRSVYDIIGPVMIGPSSSHTAGAALIGHTARKIFGEQPAKVKITFFGSFAKTYKGHGTDIAIIGGLLGFDPNDTRIPSAYALADDAGMTVEIETSDDMVPHPNTTKIEMSDKSGEKNMYIVGESIGGGKMGITSINGFQVNLDGQNPTLLVLHHDRYGAIAHVATKLAEHKVNIGYMQVARHEKGQTAMMTIELDHDISDEVVADIEKLENMISVIKLKGL